MVLSPSHGSEDEKTHMPAKRHSDLRASHSPDAGVASKSSTKSALKSSSHGMDRGSPPSIEIPSASPKPNTRKASFQDEHEHGMVEEADRGHSNKVAGSHSLAKSSTTLISSGRAVKQKKGADFVQRLIEEADHSEKKGQLRKIERIVRSNTFDVAVGFLILVNAILMGIETDAGDSNADMWLAQEVIFTTLFSIELGMRLNVYRLEFFYNTKHRSPEAWNIFDATLVMLSMVDTFVLGFFGGGGLEMVTMLRAFRLLRLTRLVRLVRLFKELLLFVTGIFAALSTLVWAFALIGMVIFLCAIFLVRSLGKKYGDDSSPDYDPHIAELFGNVGTTCITLFRIITLDAWSADVAQPVIQKEPGMVIFFILFIMVCSYGIMSVIVAVITENALSSSRENDEEDFKRKEVELRNSIKAIHNIFINADTDGDQFLSKEEFVRALNNPEVLSWLRSLDASLPDASSLFDILDYDDSGGLSGHEFIEGILRSRGTAKAKDLLALECDLWRNMKYLREIVEKLGTKMEERDARLHRRLRQLNSKMLVTAKAVGIIDPAVSAWLAPLLWQSGPEEQPATHGQNGGLAANALAAALPGAHVERSATPDAALVEHPR